MQRTWTLTAACLGMLGLIGLLQNLSAQTISQEPIILPVSHHGVIGHGQILPGHGHVIQGGPVSAPCNTCVPAVPCEHKTCVAVPDKVKISHTKYGEKCTDICVPKCAHPLASLFSLGGLGRHSKSCEQPCAVPCAVPCLQCEGPFAKRVLLKKVVTTECPSLKCVAQSAPACASGPCVSGSCAAPTASASAPQTFIEVPMATTGIPTRTPEAIKVMPMPK